MAAPGHGGGFLRPNAKRRIQHEAVFDPDAACAGATGCGIDGGEGWALRRIGRALGVDLSGGTLARFEDSHGGFHGDGLTAAEVELDGLEEGLADAPGWRPLPMTENAAQALQMFQEEGGAPEGGFYYLYDRHRQSQDPYDDSQLHQRFSWNFTLAVYDSGAGRLYYYEFDT